VFNIGPTELLVILIIALLVFGPKRLPEVGRTIGKSIREFRRASEELRDDLRIDLDASDESAAPRRTPPVVDGVYQMPSAESSAHPGAGTGPDAAEDRTNGAGAPSSGGAGGAATAGGA
jgi:sec-independent protein translocase protein TatA